MLRAFVIKRVGNLFQTWTIMHSTIPAYARISDQNDCNQNLEQCINHELTAV